MLINSLVEVKWTMLSIENYIAVFPEPCRPPQFIRFIQLVRRREARQWLDAWRAGKGAAGSDDTNISLLESLGYEVIAKL